MQRKCALDMKDNPLAARVSLWVFFVCVGLTSLCPDRAYGQQPSISGIRVTSDTNAVVVTYTVSPDSYCWVQYGVASGTYLWSSVSFQSGGQFISGLCSVPINGLKDGTTYYFLPTARPDPDDETNICNTPACGAVEQSATTPPASVSHLPAAPNPVQANLSCEPDSPACSSYPTYSNAYVTVPLAATGPAGECAASASVRAPAGYSWTITTGETLTQMIAANAMTFGTVFQVPQGVTCIVPPTDSRGHGYNLPNLAVDPLATGGLISAANHRWIIFRTAPGGPADFPPFGTRTGPSFFHHYGGFENVTANTSGVFWIGGIIFTAKGGAANPVHHVWIENLEFQADATQNVNYDAFFSFALGEAGDIPPFPSYMVLRDNYFHFPDRSNIPSGVPSVQSGIIGTAASQIAIVGNYMDNMYFSNPVGIPQGIYLMDCGFKGACSPASNVLIDNNSFQGMAMDIYVEVNNHGNPNPADYTITHNFLYWPYTTTYPYAVAIGGYGCRNQIEEKGMTRELIAGNYINGQWACANTGDAILTFNAVDLTITNNYVTNSAAGIGVNGTGNGASMNIYSSSANRITVSNNLLYNLGRSLYQAGGGGFGAPAIEMESSPSNLTVVNNTFGPIGNDNPVGQNLGFFYPWILYNGGGGQLTGLTFRNNVLPFGIGQTSYGGGIGVQELLASAGNLSHPSTPAPNSEMYPVEFSNWLSTVAGYADGTRQLGLTATSTVAPGSGYTNGNLSFTGCSSSPTGAYTTSGGAVQYSTITSFGACAPSSVTVSAGLGGASLRPHFGLTTSYNWGGNVDVCTSYSGSDMSQANCSSSSSTMPSGDVWAPGANTAQRLAAAGVRPDYSIVATMSNAGNVGANLNAILSATGTVTNVSVALSASSAAVSYTAPDDRSCSVDVSPDGVTWTRTSDSGGIRQRSIPLTGLSAATPYNYRVLCYFEQLSPLFAGSQITDGTFTTLAAGTRDPSFAFSLAEFSGSANFKVTMTAPDGVTRYANTCGASPCVLANVPVGTYSTVQQWLNGSTVIATSDAQEVAVR